MYVSTWETVHHFYVGDVASLAAIASLTLPDVGNSPPEELWPATITPGLTYESETKSLVFNGQSDFIRFGPTNFGSPFTFVIMVRSSHACDATAAPVCFFPASSLLR